MIVKPPNLLAFDTAMGGITIGLALSNGSTISRHMETQREQASHLVPMLQEVVDEGGLTFNDLDAIACSIGPGSFTGLRIGMTTAKTFGLSLAKPVIGMNTLDLMAQHYETSKNKLIILETKRQDFYACYFDAQNTPLTDPFASSEEDIIAQAPEGQFVVCGDAVERFKSSLDKIEAHTSSFEYLVPTDHPLPFIMTTYATELYNNNDYGERIEPLYLRGADTSQPKNKPRKLAGV